MMWLHQKKAAFDKRFFPERVGIWRRWKQHDARSNAPIDHGDWAELLGRYVRIGGDGSTGVAYGEFAAPDVERLDDYIARCGETAISDYSRGEQLAFWANLYNAATVRLVLAHYPLRSVKTVGWLPAWLGGGPWNQKVTTVEGFALSLNDIEHRILRRNWRDPRVHYALNCASRGCPDLRSRPFSGLAIEQELDEAARVFVNHRRGARFEADHLVVCSIYVWFKEDFGGSDAGVIEHLGRYAAPPLAERIGRAARIDRHEYDWGLNDAL